MMQFEIRPMVYVTKSGSWKMSLEQAVPGLTPDVWGVYVKDGKGLPQWVADAATERAARATVDALRTLAQNVLEASPAMLRQINIPA